MQTPVPGITATADPGRLAGAGPAQLLPSLADLSRPVTAGASVALVLAIGGLVLVRRRDAVDRSVDDLLDGPAVATLYGVVAYGLVLFVSLYVADFLGRTGAAGTPLGYVAIAVLAGGLAGLSGFGFLVVGTLLTDLRGRRAPRRGLAIGAAGSGVAWVVFPSLVALGTCVVVGAFGVGGRTRTWLHDERTVETEVDVGTESER